MITLFSAFATFLLTAQVVFFSYTILNFFNLNKHDGLLQSCSAICFSLLIYSIYFAISFRSNKKLSSSFFTTFVMSFVSVIISGILSFFVGFYLSLTKCIEAGICPFIDRDSYTTAIIIFLLSLLCLIVFFLISEITTLIVFYIYKNRSSLNNIDDKSTFTRPNIPVIFANILFLLIMIILLIYQSIPIISFELYLHNKHREYAKQHEASKQTALVEPSNTNVVVKKCQPYQHCGDEKIDVEKVLNSVNKQEVPAQLNHFQRWAIALGAMTIQLNNGPHDQLSLISHLYSSKEQLVSINTMMYNSWEIKDRQSTIKVLSWLGNTGHSGEQYEYYYSIVKENPEMSSEQLVQQMATRDNILLIQTENKKQVAAFDYVKNNLTKTDDNLIYAWDYGRFIFVVRGAYTQGFLTKAESLALIEQIGLRTRKRFNSWKDFGDNYVTGRIWWVVSDPSKMKETNDLYAILIGTSGVWNVIPWKWSKQ